MSRSSESVLSNVLFISRTTSIYERSSRVCRNIALFIARLRSRSLAKFSPAKSWRHISKHIVHARASRCPSRASTRDPLGSSSRPRDNNSPSLSAEPEHFSILKNCLEPKNFLQKARSLMVVVSSPPTQVYEVFTKRVREYNSKEPFNFIMPELLKKFEKVIYIYPLPSDGETVVLAKLPRVRLSCDVN